jgi:hypothetical protein
MCFTIENAALLVWSYSMAEADDAARQSHAALQAVHVMCEAA